MFQVDRLIIVPTLVCGLLSAATAVAAGDAQKGQQLAAQCATCHGPQGKGAGATPGIAGMPVDTFVTTLNAYKTGARQHPVMSNIAKRLSEADMANLAAYYATK